tara:strand:- start:373 stop:924 length:552 start_codon:yes stop_codon:yes gene_type:complete
MGMMEKRGYVVDNFTNEQIIKTFKNREFKYSVNKEDLITQIIFIFNIKIKPNGIRDYLNDILENTDPENIDSIVFILPIKISTSLSRVMNDQKFKELNIQFFSSKELIIDITQHSLNPLFNKIEKDEINDLIKKYKIDNKTMLPIMLSSDPISRIYNFKPGDICKITRKSPTNLKCISYRLIK